jgi:hypothetical protein
MKAVCGAMPRMTGCGAMPHDGDGMVIDIMEESAMSRAGLCARWRGDWRCDGGVHGKKVRGDRALMLSFTVRRSCFVAISRLGGEC